MDPQKFTAILQNLSLLHDTPAAELKAITQQYPYFAMAHVLLLKKFQIDQHPDFDALLPQVAIRVANRKRLKAFMAAEIPAPALAGQEETPDNFSPSATPATDTADTLLDAMDDHTPAAEEEVPADAKNTPDTGADRAREQVDEKQNAATEESPAHKAMHREPEDASEPEQSFDAQPHSFTEWLQHFSRKDKAPEPPNDAPLADPAATAEAAWQQQLTNKVPESPMAVTGPAAVPEEELEKVEDQARKSVAMGQELVTETLAQIFVQQGNVEKAIHAYTQLRLKYPEKSDYFAAKIQELQEKGR